MMPRIMIVDDDVSVQMELEEYLNHEDYTVVGVADTGPMAIEMARALSPDLILMDVVIRGETDGILAAEKIKRETDAAIIFVTGYDEPEYVERAKHVAPFGYIMKPFDEREIRGAIEIALHKKMLELKLAETHRRLEKSEAHFRMFMDFTADWEYWLEPDGRFGYVSPSCEDITGYPPDAFVKDPGLFRRIVHPEDRAMVLGHLKEEKGMTKPDAIDFRIISRGGKARWISHRCKPVYDSEGVYLGQRGSQRDITDRKEIETALAQTGKDFRELVETINDVFYTTDRNGNLTYVSPQMMPIMGHNPSEVLGTPFKEFIHPDDLPLIMTRFQEIQHGILKPAEYRLRDAWGKYRWIRSSTRPIFNEDGFAGLKGLFSDITEERQIQQARERARQLEGLRTLAGGISHDYNNLLAIILGNLSLVREDKTLGLETLGFLEEIEQASLAAKDLTRRLMTLTKGGATFNWKTDSIKSLLEGCISQNLKRSTVICNAMIPENLHAVCHDPEPLEYAFTNVLTNALETMPEGGTVTVSAENFSMTHPDPNISDIKPGKYVKVVIQDQGTGISPEDLPSVFNPYFSTKEMGTQKGMGLGLTTTYTIIEKHGGSIDIESQKGEGTTVSIYLPAALAMADNCVGTVPQKDPAVPTKQEPLAMKRVLLMDDEEMLRKLGVSMLKRLGYACESVTDGNAAIGAYQKAMDSGKPFDAVMLDLTIKGGDGRRGDDSSITADGPPCSGHCLQRLL